MSDNFTTKDASNATITLATSEDASGVHSSKTVLHTILSSSSLTRPNDTTAYAAEDAITSATSSATSFSFTGCARIDEGMGIIRDALMICSDETLTADFELWLFDTEPAIPNDNAAFDFTDNEAATVVAVLKFNATESSASASNIIYRLSNGPHTFKCASGSQVLYGVLKTADAFTPVALSTFNIKLMIEQHT